jgi:hypothetical protein
LFHQFGYAETEFVLGALSQASGHPITTAFRASAASHYAGSPFAARLQVLEFIN